jgi:hypothetical protein
VSRCHVRPRRRWRADSQTLSWARSRNYPMCKNAATRQSFYTARIKKRRFKYASATSAIAPIATESLHCAGHASRSSVSIASPGRRRGPRRHASVPERSAANQSISCQNRSAYAKPRRMRKPLATPATADEAVKVGYRRARFVPPERMRRGGRRCQRTVSFCRSPMPQTSFSRRSALSTKLLGARVDPRSSRRSSSRMQKLSERSVIGHSRGNLSSGQMRTIITAAIATTKTTVQTGRKRMGRSVMDTPSN